MSQLLTQPKRHRLSSEEELSDDEEESDYKIKHAGSIKKLTLKNFMCHDHFELGFGPHMNFIIGRNGSGKSAILTGISVGLGAKANDTSRGSAMKALIKHGKSTARVVVELENDGLNAYEPETYGKLIFVERKLVREGQATYAIKSENGSVVSTKKSTLDDILQRFFIVVNNPLSFLSQDKAREFIATSTEQSRYTFFAEGTSIQAIIRNYQEISQKIQNLQSLLVESKEHFKEATNRYLEVERVYKKYKESNTLRQQLEKIHGKIYWFNVEVMKKVIGKKEVEISEKCSKIQDIKQTLESNKDAIDQEEKEVTALRTEKREIEAEYVAKDREFAQVETSHEEAARKVQNLNSDLRSYKTEIEEYSRKVQEHKAELAREQKKVDDANGGSKEAMAERIEVLKAHHEKLVSSREEIERQLSEADRTSPEMVQLNKDIGELASTIGALRDKMSSANNAKKDRYAAFGLNIGRLVNEIARERSWHQKPIGPIGCYVSVKSDFSKWSDLINASLQGTLDSFVVCDEHDRKLLIRLMLTCKVNKTVTVRRFEKFSYNKPVSSQYATMLDALEFQDEDAKFTLIDSTGLEEMVICETVSQAEEATRDRSVKQALSLNDRKSGTRVARRDGHLSRDPVFYARDLRKLAGKVDSASFENDLRDLARQETQLKEQRRRLIAQEREKKAGLERDLRDKKEQIKNINNLLYKAELALREEGDHARIANLQLQIELCDNHIKTREGMSMELLQNMAECKRDLRQIKASLEQEKEARRHIADKLADCEKRINRHNDVIDLYLSEIEKISRKREEMSIAIDLLRQKIADENIRLQEMVNLALERCARSEVVILETDTSKSITAEFKSIKQAIEEMERQNEKSFEDVQRELLDSKALKENCERSLVEIETARVSLENDLNARFENLHITIQEKINRAKYSFEQSLALRGFKGNLQFDFKNHKVITEVQTEDNKDARAVLSLSGGEKSFTQIAFLLSIWKIMKPRVCGLDEFDVYMDSVNRTIAIRLLIHELRHSAAQSIFITPQDIAVVGDLQDSEDVRIHKILPPREE